MNTLSCVQKNGMMEGHTTFAPSRTIQGSRTAALFSSVQAGKAWKRSRQARRSPHIRSFHCLLGRFPFTILSTDVGSMHRLDPRILPVLAGQETKKPKIKFSGISPLLTENQVFGLAGALPGFGRGSSTFSHLDTRCVSLVALAPCPMGTIHPVLPGTPALTSQDPRPGVRPRSHFCQSANGPRRGL